MKSRLKGIWITLLAMGCFSAGAPLPGFAAPGTVIATVGSTGIVQSELDARATEMELTYRKRMGKELNAQDRTSIRRQALETLVRQRLYSLASGRANVTDAEVEAYLKRMPIFNPNGQFSQRAWDNARGNDPASFKKASAEARRELGAQRLSESLRKRYTPPDDVLRRTALRELESADVQYLSLPASAFDGRLREPSEIEVLDEYRRHLREFDRPAEATVRAVLFETDNVSAESLAPLRQKALQAIAAIQGGMPLGEAADQFGGRQRRMTLRDDNLPGSWRGTAAQNARLFNSRPGDLFNEPVASANGFYVLEVDTAATRRAGTLAEASPVIRNQLRREFLERSEEADLTRFFAAVQDSLGRPGYKLRCAVVDAARMKLADPSVADLQSFYQSRLADYSRFDPVAQSLTITPFEEVRAALTERWKASRRDLLARDLANRILDAWNQGRRDRSLESQARILEPGAVPYGAALDLGVASSAVSDSLRHRIYGRLLEIFPFSSGYAVTHAYEMVERLLPSLDQVRAPLIQRLHVEQESAEIEQARKIYESDPDRYLTGKLIHYTRLWVPQPEVIDVPLSREEVESYYREHLSDYGSPERFRLRHLLIKPKGGDPGAQEHARERATSLFARIRAGEDLAHLARQFSDDDKTRDDGGDLSYRSAGELPPEIQNVGFALKVGQVSEPVLSVDGYHILRLDEHVPEVAEPLAWVYTSVGVDAALKKSQAMARQYADSLSQVIRSPAQGRLLAERLNLPLEHYRHRPGDRGFSENLIPMAERLERMKPGEIYPGSEYFLGQGAAAMWVDSIAPPRLQSWEIAQTPVLVEYRRRMGQRAMDAKQTELDSLLRAGWSFDSLGSLWGGLSADPHYTRRKGLAKLGASVEVDSLVFGAGSSPPLQPGAVSGWLDVQDAALRLRVNGRRTPAASEVEQHMGPMRGLLVEYGLREELKELKRQFPVRIVDPRLREVTLPPLPPRPEL